MGRPRIHDQHTRERLLERAAEIITTSGVRALSVRSLASDAGTSTAAVYTLFGGKSGLVTALYRQAFERFAQSLAEVSSGPDPVDDIVRLGLAYRRHAVADPNGYRVMFGDELRPSDVPRRAFRAGAQTFDPLLDAVRRAVDMGRFPAEPSPEAIATALWANVHGLVSLELGEFVPPSAGDTADVFEAAVRANTAGWTAMADARK
ncbi:TetR family transcriptional regulator [Haloactinopolyspora alba]|uniref:TetR family transcriptional regulator n=1 Tax=Haloactinopolyspora alba TaxID=648780 RepID=A0A2P8DYT3_9ACTN|nr:TetR/AcrR family transcriptional regulator [Haloactinopolyspora alba]PSL02376.1 TetR family transcriptional regulator [Haloactinopolyspora alba]